MIALQHDTNHDDHNLFFDRICGSGHWMVESVKHSATDALDAKHKYMVELYTEIAVGPKRVVSFLGAYTFKNGTLLQSRPIKVRARYL